MRYKDTRGDDSLVGTSADDLFKVRRGGTDTVTGGGGFDRLEVDYSEFSGTPIGRSSITVSDNRSLYGELLGVEQGDRSSTVTFVDIDRITYAGTDGHDELQLTVQAQPDRHAVSVDLGGGDDYLFINFNVGAQSVQVNADGTLETSVGTFAGVEQLSLDFGDEDDVAMSGAGDDFLYGDGGADRLSGGAGADLIYGNAGADTLTGGQGADIFAYTTLDPKLRGVDVIQDFSHSDGDRIDLYYIDADSTVGKNQNFVFIDQQQFTGAGGTNGEVRQQVNGDGTVTLQTDMNHDGKADFSILLHIAAPLVAADIIL